MSRTRLPIAPLVIGLVLSGCPRSFDPAAAPNLTSPNPQANSAFTKARRLFEAGSLARADSAFDAYLKAHSTDNLVPQAAVFRGRIALRQNRPKVAQKVLAAPATRPAGDETGLQARYYLGLASVRAGAHAEARRLLGPYLKIVESDKLPPVLVGLAHACVQLRDFPAAVLHLSRLHEATGRPTEKAYARQVMERVVDTDLTEQQLRAAHGAADSGSLLAALTGRRMARLARAAGKGEEAARLLRDTAGARASHQVDLGPQTTGAAAVRGNLVGLLVPLRGRYRLAGKQLLAGALEGARSFEAGGRDRVTLVISDSSKDPAGAARKLLEQRGVVALAGTLDPASSRAVAAVAASHDAPFVSLAGSRAGNKKGGSTLRIFPTNAARAEALARHAIKTLGLRTAMVMGPDTPYGDRMVMAFARAVTAHGGKVKRRYSYRRGSTSFAKQAKQLARVPFDALFVADTARTLALITPALAKAGLWSAAPGKKTAKGTRSYQLLATGEGISRRRLAAAARYMKAAVLAPGYFPVVPAAGEPTTPVSRFAASHGRPPTLVEAFAYDAVHALSRHLSPSIKARAQLLGKLRGQPTGKPAGLTGVIRFGAKGQRADPPMLFRVENGVLVKQ